MTVVLHLVGLEILTTRVVHHHDESAVDGSAHHFLIERQRGVLLRLAERTAVLILEGIGERLRGCTQRQFEHAVDLCQHVGLGLGDIGRLLLLGHHIAQLEAELAQLR